MTRNPYLQGPKTGTKIPRDSPPTLQRAQEMEQLANPPRSLPVPRLKVGTRTKKTPEQTSFPNIHHEDIP